MQYRLYKDTVQVLYRCNASFIYADEGCYLNEYPGIYPDVNFL